MTVRDTGSEREGRGVKYSYSPSLKTQQSKTEALIMRKCFHPSNSHLSSGRCVALTSHYHNFHPFFTFSHCLQGFFQLFSHKPEAG